MEKKEQNELEPEGIDEILMMDGVTPIKNICIKNHSVFTKDGYIRMNKVNAQSSLLMIATAWVGLIVINVLLYLQKSWTFAIITSVLVVAYPFILKLLSTRQINRTFKMYEGTMGNASYDYEFKDGQIDFTFKSKTQTSPGSIKYSSIYHVICDDDYVFVFISSNQIYIIEKKGFEEGEMEKAIDLLKSKGIRVKDKSKKK